jgi:hypothetical protein
MERSYGGLCGDLLFRDFQSSLLQTLMFTRYLESEDRLEDLIVLEVIQHDSPHLGDLFCNSTKSNGGFENCAVRFCETRRFL